MIEAAMRLNKALDAMSSLKSLQEKIQEMEAEIEKLKFLMEDPNRTNEGLRRFTVAVQRLASFCQSLDRRLND